MYICLPIRSIKPETIALREKEYFGTVSENIDAFSEVYRKNIWGNHSFFRFRFLIEASLGFHNETKDSFLLHFLFVIS